MIYDDRVFLMEQFAEIVNYSQKSLDSGNLGILEFKDLPFEPKRIYWLSKVVANRSRGNHAHKTLRQYFIVLGGVVEIELSNGTESVTHSLCDDGQGLFISPGLWRNLRNFSDNALVLVVCDQAYDENDYIRDFQAYLEWVQNSERG
jgi:dTDP-4-dehydrorhamnose 3,5-epimerase-like enzyme